MADFDDEKEDIQRDIQIAIKRLEDARTKVNATPSPLLILPFFAFKSSPETFIKSSDIIIHTYQQKYLIQFR